MRTDNLFLKKKNKEINISKEIEKQVDEERDIVSTRLGDRCSGISEEDLGVKEWAVNFVHGQLKDIACYDNLLWELRSCVDCVNTS